MTRITVVIMLMGALLGGLVAFGASRLLAQPVAAGAACETPAAFFDAPDAPRLALEVARTPEEHQVGLMHRQSLPTDSGMLFVFEQATRARFWMKDTLIPLSIAFIQDDGTILDIQDMQPLSEEPHGISDSYRYAIEANQGWFAANGVQPGQHVSFCFAADASE